MRAQPMRTDVAVAQQHSARPGARPVVVVSARQLHPTREIRPRLRRVHASAPAPAFAVGSQSPRDVSNVSNSTTTTAPSEGPHREATWFVSGYQRSIRGASEGHQRGIRGLSEGYQRASEGHQRSNHTRGIHREAIRGNHTRGIHREAIKGNHTRGIHRKATWLIRGSIIPEGSTARPRGSKKRCDETCFW